MGTPQFAADILDEIARHHDVVCVYTQPDKVRGRGKNLVASPVKTMAQDLEIEVRTPDTLRDSEQIELLCSLAPDVICVAAYGMILPKEVLDIPQYGCLNVHASLLPRWRGAAPIEHAIMAGDEFAGVCIMRMEEGLDTGDWCVCRKIPIEGMSSTELTEELAELGAKALLSALEQVSSGSARWNSQDDDLATYAPKIEKRELWLQPDKPAEEEFRKFLASTPNHPSKVNLNGKVCTLCEASLVDREDAGPISSKQDSVVAGDLIKSGKRLFMAFDDGIIEVLSLKPDGKQQMEVASYLAGAHLDEQAKWEAA